MEKLPATWPGLVWGAVVAVAVSGCVTAREPEPPRRATEPWEVEEIAAVRRTLRSACGKLRSVGAAQAQKAALEKAREETDSALAGWSCLIQSWTDVPEAYARHPDWRGATAEITAGITEMLRQAEADKAPEAFQACGRTCGLFVKLDEAAGIRRTSDVLFQFRQAAKPLAEHVQPRNVGPLCDADGRLRELRDLALTDPVGGTGTPQEQRAALKRFSEAVDAFLKAAADDSATDLPARYQAMMQAMEQAYDLFL